MKQKTKMRAILGGILAILILAGCFFGAQAILMPKYQTSLQEGSLVGEYYDDIGNHDVLFVGDCEVYENFSPITLWKEQGITSYIRGSSQQLIWQSYYLLEEMLSKETPKVVVFNVLSMKYGEPQSEAYNRLTLDGMRMSSYKLDAVKASMMEDETLISYVFPLLRYHARFSELGADDFTYLFQKKQISHNGYLMRVDVKPEGTYPSKKPLSDYNFSDVCWDYLDKMRTLCEEKGVEFVLIKSPCVYPYWYDEWDTQIQQYADAHGLLYENFISQKDAIGLDMSVDTYDAGLHLNLSGAEKLTSYFGEILSENFEFPDHSEDADLQELWGEKERYYEWMKEDQLRELEQYGKLISY